MNRKMEGLVSKQDSLGSLFNISRFDDLFDELYTVMDQTWNRWDLNSTAFHSLQPKSKFPKINVSETDSAYEVEIATSGIDKNNLELEFRDSCLFIKADKSEDESSEDKKWLKREISSRSFRRTLQFPVKIDSASISSKYDEDKCLVICTLPKKKKNEPDTIKIDIN